MVVPNAATRELWRIADTGEMDDLEGVLPQADINARNEHGMTALMRAAYHGRVRLVRVLLEHGADPNVTRNDNFTALSLAAFFGHAEIVEILMQHGAKTDVPTRFGTSPQIWAKARSYGDVARSLEKRRDNVKKRPEDVKSVSSASSLSPVVPPEPKPEPEPTPAPEVEPMVIRTLKEPPEIWDLVHEAPRNFNARSAFIARMGRLNGALAITLFALGLISAGASAAFYFRNKLPARLSSVPAPTAAAATVPAPVVNQTSNTPTTVAPGTSAVATEAAPVEVNTTPVPHRSRSFARPRATANSDSAQPTTVETVVAPPPAVTLPKPEPRTSPEAETKKPATPVNSQMISPPKPSQPKAKVIQWP
jgi:hypothetical protein